MNNYFTFAPVVKQVFSLWFLVFFLGGGCDGVYHSCKLVLQHTSCCLFPSHASISTTQAKKKERTKAKSQQRTTTSFVSKIFVQGQHWEKKEIFDYIYWLRQLAGLLCGVLWGLLPLTGFIGNLR